MDLRIFTEPQFGATYDQQAALARVAEECGFDGYFRSDHYLNFGPGDGRPGPTDTWVTLGAIARETTTIRLGTLVCSATFRLPGPLAVAVAQVDAMSGGRVDLGIGAGWFDDEHTAYGIPFPTLRQRFDALEEQLAITSGWWQTPQDGEYSFEGDHYTVIGSPVLPRPAQPGGPPIIIGGFGTRRTPALAARYAHEFNLPFGSLADFREQRERVHHACEAIDRDPDELVYSVAQVVCCGATDAEVERRAGEIGRTADDLRRHAVAGTPSEVLETLASHVEAGVERIYLQVLDLDDHDHLRLIADDVLRVLP